MSSTRSETVVVSTGDALARQRCPPARVSRATYREPFGAATRARLADDHFGETIRKALRERSLRGVGVTWVLQPHRDLETRAAALGRRNDGLIWPHCDGL